MNKSNFQILAEELEEEVSTMAREFNIKKQLLEKAPPPDFGKVDYATAYDAEELNLGGIAGLAVGAAANPLAVVMNPNVLSAVKGKILPDADPRITKYQPYYSSNLATMMGLGIDPATFKRAADFMNMYSPTDGSLAEKDDPEQSTALDWKRLNHAVSNHLAQKAKEKLSQNHLFRGPATSNYEQAVSDSYQRFDLTKRARKVADQTANEILTGKVNKLKGRDVDGYVRQLSQGQKNRMANTWNQNPDQSGKIQLKR